MMTALGRSEIISRLAQKEDRFVFSDGLYDAELSRVNLLPHGVSVRTDGGFCLKIPDKVIIEDMVHLVFLAGAESSIGTPKEFFPIEINAGASTRLNIVFHKIPSTEGRFFSRNIAVRIFLAEGACVDFYQLEEPGLEGEFSTENIFDLRKHSSLDYFVFSGARGRSCTRTTVDFQEEHGFFSAKGISVLKGASSAEHALWVNHRVGHCISRQYYKSVLAGESKSVFESFVRVFESAVKSDSQQLNRNLLLSDTARAQSKPELRIDNDDVAASHGSASGQIDEDELFYLRTRGLSERFSRLVLVGGFAREMLADVHEKNLREHLETALGDEIEDIVGGMTG